MIILAVSSGTSADAVDVAAARFEQIGDTLTMTPLGAAEHPWRDGLDRRIRALYPPASTTIGEVCALDTLIGQEFAYVAVAAAQQLGLARPDLIVSHGQTVFHWVEEGTAHGTLQLGQPAWIAEATGVPVLSNVRARDVAAGGQGAPLASTFDALWLRAAAQRAGVKRVAALNLGGLANVTVSTPEKLVSFDTGPASCLIDAAIVALGDGQTYDAAGRLGAIGSVRTDLLDRLLADPYFSAAPPKSTGREHFHTEFVRPLLPGLPPVSDQDLVATLTELTARTVADQLSGVDLVIASGGGVRNRTLMRALQRRLGDVPLRTSDEYGVAASAKEAYLFTLLGYLSVTGQPGTVASPASTTTTGAVGPRILGDFTPGSGALVLPPPSAPVRALDWVEAGN